MKKILIIEDDELLGDLLLQNLSTAGFDCELVRDGLKGYSRIGELMPDLVVSDLFLPSLSGFEILSQKRLDVKIATVPIIILTNSLRPTSIGSIENLGADDFMVNGTLVAMPTMISENFQPFAFARLTIFRTAGASLASKPRPRA